MKNSVLLNGVILLVILLIKVLNTTFKMVIDAVELLNEMIRIIRRNYTKGNMLSMLLMVLMVKLLDAMISNTLSFVVEMIRIITKIGSISELTELAELMLAVLRMLLISIKELINSNLSKSGSDSNTFEIVGIMVIKTEKLISALLNSIKRFEGSRTDHKFLAEIIYSKDPVC